MVTCIHDSVIYLYYIFTEPECNDGDIRLMGGYISTVGRVEVCQYGTWGTICRSDNFEWNYYDAMVVCRQLGYYNQCMTCSII